MFLNRIISVFFNVTVLSRFVVNLTIIAFVFILGVISSDDFATEIFIILSIIKMTAAFMSFGFGANILKPLIEASPSYRTSLLLHIVVVKIIFAYAASFAIYYLGIISGLDFHVIFFLLLGAVWGFVDIYVESMSRPMYNRYFITKAVFSVFALILKLLFIKINHSYLYYILTIEGAYSLVFIMLTHIKKSSIKEGIKLNYFRDVYKLIKYGFYIWVSSFLQIGGSRTIYLLINASVMSNFSVFYYILLRLTEGLVFIPNNICARFYKKIILAKKDLFLQQKLRYKMLFTCLTSSFDISPILFIILFIYLEFKLLDVNNYYALILFPMVIAINFLSFIRVWVSREIILNENFIASPFSYLISLLFTIIGIHFFSDKGIWIVVSLVMYYGASSITPFLINTRKMASTRTIFKKLYNG